MFVNSDLHHSTIFDHQTSWPSVRLSSGARPQFVLQTEEMPVHQHASPTLLNPPKILLYSHDTAGLGNIRRTLLLAEALQQRFEDGAILIVTGSPVIHSYTLPSGIDYVKLPCVDRVAADTYTPRFLREWPEEISTMRQSILVQTILDFQPDLMIVDKRPGGVDNELIETLEQLHSLPQRPRLVLGVRDILDAPEATKRSLAEGRAFELIDRYYDEVWIYGSQAIFDHTGEYDYPQSVIDKVHYCGYLRRPTQIVLRKGKKQRVLLTTGGGGDGAKVVEAYLEGLTDLPRRVALRTKIIFGPQMPEAERERLLNKYGHMADVKFRDFKQDLTKDYAKADVVVAMAGYNTVCELLSFGKRAVLVPREMPVQEQLIRARRLAHLGCFNVVEGSELTPQTLMNSVLDALAQESPDTSAFDMNGLDSVGERATALLRRADNETYSHEAQSHEK